MPGRSTGRRTLDSEGCRSVAYLPTSYTVMSLPITPQSGCAGLININIIIINDCCCCLAIGLASLLLVAPRAQSLAVVAAAITARGARPAYCCPAITSTETMLNLLHALPLLATTAPPVAKLMCMGDSESSGASSHRDRSSLARSLAPACKCCSAVH